MMDYKHFIPAPLVDICPSIFQGGCRVAGICVSQKPCKIVWKTLKKPELSILWFEDNYMNLNTGKSHLLIFRHK